MWRRSGYLLLHLVWLGLAMMGKWRCERVESRYGWLFGS